MLEINILSGMVEKDIRDYLWNFKRESLGIQKVPLFSFCHFGTHIFHVFHNDQLTVVWSSSNIYLDT